MASGDSIGSRQHASEGLSGSFSAGSEESFTYECDACKLDGKIKEAKVYCNNCEDLLCDTCELYHSKVKATRFHKIVTGEKIPLESMTNRVGQLVKQQSIKNLCACNQNRDVDFYCSDHDDVFCSVCKTVLHKKCDTAAIEESCSKIQIAEVFKRTSEKISTLLEQAQQFEKKNKENLITLLEMEAKCRDEIKMFRIKINSLLDDLEENALSELQHQASKQSAVIRDREETVSDTLEFLKADNNDCKELMKKSADQQMFITNNKISKRLSKYELALKESSSIFCQSIEFKKNDELLHVKTLGKVHVVSFDKMVHKQRTIPVLLDAEVKKHKTVTVKQDSDMKKPWITGIAFLPNDELLITDTENRKITWFDKTITIKQSKICPGKPWDIAVINEQEAVVTLTNEHKLLFVQFGYNLTFGRSIELKKRGLGVTMVNDLYYVCCNEADSESQIQVFDKDGYMILTIRKDQIGRELYTPYYITSNKQGDKLFISEEKELICISTSGNLLFTVFDQSLQGPRGMIVDAENNVLVCLKYLGNIGLIKPDGTLHRILLQDSKIPGPYSIDYRVSDGLVAVGSCEDGYLHILALC